MHDGSTFRKSILVKRVLEDREIPICECQGNSPYLNSIENTWNLIKNNAQENQPINITYLNEMLTDLWIHMNLDYFIKFVPERHKSHMNIYELYI